MPVTVTELQRSRDRSFSGDEGDATLRFLIEGTTDDATADAALVSSSPATYRGLLRSDFEVEELKSGLYLGSVEYNTEGERNKEKTTTGDLPAADDISKQFRFQIGTTSEHVTNSLETRNTYSVVGAGTAPDFETAVNVTPQGGVQGVDVLVPTATFSERGYFLHADLDATYKQNLYDLVGKTNNALFKGHAAGEVLFLGAAGSYNERRGWWEIDFQFGWRPNQTGLTVGSITGIAKDGWDYLWFVHTEERDATANALVRRPKHCYRERVYAAGDFSVLGL